MNDDIFFSVCIPTYNRAGTLPDAIDSVLQQEYKNYELLIVDNASTDNTVNILKDYTDPRIRIVHNPSTVSMYANHNICIDEATYEWMIFLHSDDTLSPLALQNIYSDIKQNLGLAMLIPIKDHPQFRNNTLLNGKSGLPNLFRFMNVTPSGCLINRDTIIKNKIRYDEKIIPADLEFCAEVLNKDLNIILTLNKLVNVGRGVHQYSFLWEQSGAFVFDVSKVIKKYIAPTISVFKEEVRNWEPGEQARLFMFLAHRNGYKEIEAIEKVICDKSYKKYREYYHVLLGRFVGSTLLRFIYKIKNIVKYRILK